MSTHDSSSQTERIPLEPAPGAEGDDASSHLAVRYSPPRTPGDDVAILYLHGFGSRQDGEKATFFRTQAEACGLGFCSFDFQGHGDSGGSLLGLTASRNLADVGRVHALLRERGIRRVILMGSSMGGGCALWYAALHPEGIAAAVHVAPALELEVGLARWAGPEGMVRWEQDGRFTFQHDLVTCDLSWSLIEDLRSFDPARLRASYQTPTLLFQGVHDDSVSWQAVADFVAQCDFGGVELHLFGDGDHRLIPHLDQLWHRTHNFLATRGLVTETSET